MDRTCCELHRIQISKQHATNYIAFLVVGYYCMKPESSVPDFSHVKTRPESLVSDFIILRLALIGISLCSDKASRKMFGLAII